MAHRRRGFAAINVKPKEQEDHDHDSERIEALEARLVKQYQDAIGHITGGRNATARDLLQQLLLEPLLQDQQVARQTAGAGATNAAAAQSKVLHGMRYNILCSLAPLLGQTQEALDLWSQVIQQNPANIKAWEEASITLAHLGHLYPAVIAAERALRLKPDSTVLLERLVLLCAALGDWTGAGQLLLDLARLTGGFHQWLEGLSNVAPKTTGFTQQDIEQCLQQDTDIVEHLIQQAMVAGNRELEQQQRQQGPLVKVLQVSSIQDLLQQLLQQMGSHCRIIKPATGRAAIGSKRARCSLISPVKQGPACVNSSNAIAAGPSVVGAEGAAAAGTASSPGAGVVAGEGSDTVPLAQVKIVRSHFGGPAAADVVTGRPAEGAQQQSAAAVDHDLVMSDAVDVQHQPQQQGPLVPELPGHLQLPHEQLGDQPEQQDGLAPQGPGASLAAAGGVLPAAAPTASRQQRSAKPPAGAASGRARGSTKHSKSAGDKVHKPVITAMQLVQETVGRWLPHAVPCPALGASSGASAAAVSSVTGVLAPELPQQHQQQPWTSARHTHLATTITAAAAGSTATAAAAFAFTWEQREQQLLQESVQLPSCYPMQMTQQLLAQLLRVAEEQKVPSDACSLLLQLADFVPIEVLTQQQHLVLAELHVDAAAAVAAAGKVPQQNSNYNKTLPLSSAEAAPQGATAPVGLPAKAPAASAGGRKRRLTAASGTTVGRGNSASAVQQQQATSKAAAGPPGTNAAVNRGATDSAALGAVMDAADLADADVPDVSAAKRVRVASRHRQQGPAQTVTVDANTAPATTSGGQSRCQKRPEQAQADALQRQQQLLLEQHVQQHLDACQLHLQQFVAAQTVKELNRHSAAKMCDDCTSGCKEAAAHAKASDEALPASRSHCEQWQSTLWDPAQNQDMRGLCELKSMWWQKLQDSCHQRQQEARRFSSNAVAGTPEASAGQQQQLADHCMLSTDWVHLIQQRTGVSRPAATALQATNKSSTGSNSSTSVASSTWGPSIAGWSLTAAVHQQQHQQQQTAPHVLGQADVVREDWGLTLRVPGLAAFGSSRLLSPAAVGAQSIAANTADGGSYGTDSNRLFSSMQLHLPAADVVKLFISEGSQQAADSDQVQVGSLMDVWPAAEAAAGTEALAPAADVAAHDTADLRRWWVSARLFEAQHELQAADAAGRCCLKWFTASAAAAASVAQLGKEAAMGPEVSGAAVVCLPSCQYDACISRVKVEQKLDRMWLTMQITAASNQQKEQEQLYSQLLQVAAPVLQPLQQQQNQPCQQAVQLPQQAQQQLDHVPPVQQQALQLQQQLHDTLLQLVQQIHGVAEAVLRSLRQRCLDDLRPGDASAQKLEGLKLIQKTSQRAAIAVSIAVATCTQSQPQDPVLLAPADLRHPISALQQQQQRFRCTELRCILVQLQRLLHLILPQVSPGTSSAAQLLDCLKDLHRLWDTCTKSPSSVAELAAASASSKRITLAYKRRQQQQSVGDATKPQGVEQHEHTVAGTAGGEAGQDTEHVSAPLQQRQQRQGVQQQGSTNSSDTGPGAFASGAMAEAAAALAAAEAFEQVQQSEQMLLLELQQQPGLLVLLGAVQQQLLELLASKCPKEFNIPVVTAAAAHPVQAGAVLPQHAAAGQTSAAAATQAAPAAAGTRQTRHRTPTAIPAGSSAAQATAAAVPTTPHASSSGRGLHVHDKLDLRSNRERELLQKAALGVLALHELDPRSSGDAERLLGLVEGLYGLLSLRFGTVDDGLVRMLRAMWSRLLLAFHKLKQQQDQQASSHQDGQQQQRQQQLLLRVDQALAQLLLDIHGFDVPWRSKTFGWEPLITAVAAAAARHAAAAPAVAAAAGPSAAAARDYADSTASSRAAADVATLGDVALAACQPVAATSHAQQQVLLPNPAAVAAAAVRAVQQLPAGAHLNKQQQQQQQQQHHSGDEAQDRTLEWSLFTHNPELQTNLTDLLVVWRCVSLWAQPESIKSNPRILHMQQQHSAGPATVHQQLTTVAATAVAAVLGSREQQQQQPPSFAVHADQRHLQLTGLATGHTGDIPTAPAHGRSRQLESPGSSSSDTDTDSDDSDDDGEDIEWPASALGIEELFWERLQPIVQKVREQVPGPPTALLAAAARRLIALLDVPQLQIGLQEVTGGEVPQSDSAALQRFFTPNAQQDLLHQPQRPVMVAAAAVADSDAGDTDDAARGCVRESPSPDTVAAVAPATEGAVDVEDSVMTDAADAQQALTAANSIDSPATAANAPGTISVLSTPADSAVPAPMNTFSSVYGWTEADLRLVKDTISLHHQQQLDLASLSGPEQVDLAAADPLLEVHRLLYHASGFNMPEIELGSVNLSEGLTAEVAACEQQLLAHVAVSPDSIRPWQRLSQLYYSILQEMLEKAAGEAPPKDWRSAAAAAATGAAAADLKPAGSGPSRWQALHVLQRYSCRALRSTVVMTHMLQQQRQQQCEIRDEDDEYVIADRIDELGMLLRDAAMCLGPWFEPWQHRPGGSAFRRQLLQTAQTCFKRAQLQLQSQAWEFPFAVGQTAAKIKAAGWWQQALQHYALACHQSRSADKHQAAVLLPYVKLHGTRLKLLIKAIGTCGSTISSDAAAVEQSSGLPPLVELLELLELLSRWCFAEDARSQLQVMLAVLQGSPLLQCPQQRQQQLLRQLQQRLTLKQQQQQQQQQQPEEDDIPLQQQQQELLEPWVKAVQLLLEDCCCALHYCQECYSRPLGPARYALARGLFNLARYDEAFAELEPLFKLSGPRSVRYYAMPFSETLLTEESDIKSSHQPHSRKPQQQHMQESTSAEPLAAGSTATARKRRRISSTVALTGAVPARQSVDAVAVTQQQQQMQDACGTDLAQAGVAESSWGSRPEFVRGWGEEENSRQFNMRNRRSLLLYLKIITAKRDMQLLEQAREGLLGSVGKINTIISEGFKPKDLGDLAVGLQLHLLLLELGPALQQYQHLWRQQQQQQGHRLSDGLSDTEQAARAEAAMQGDGLLDASHSRQAMPSTAAGDNSVLSQSAGSPFKLREMKAGAGNSQMQVFLDILAGSCSSSSSTPTAAAGGPTVTAALSDHVLALLEGTFQLYFTRLQLLSPEDERLLQLGQLLAAAERLMQDSQPAAAAAATHSRAAAVTDPSEFRSSLTFHDDKAAEDLLQFLAHAYLAAQLHQLQQAQAAGAAVSGSASSASGSSSSTAVAKLAAAAKQLRRKWTKPLRNLSLQHQRYVAVVQHLMRATAQLLMQCQQQLVTAAEVTVQSQLAATGLLELQALQLQQLEHVRISRAGSAAATGGGGAARAGSPREAMPQQQQLEPMQVDGSDSPGTKAGADDEQQQQQQGQGRAVTPAPPDTPGEPEANAATPGETAVATGNATTPGATPGLTPGGIAEARRSRRAAAAAAAPAAGHDHSAAAPGTSGLHNGMIRVVFDNPNRVAAVQAVLPAMKAVQDLSKVSCSSWLDDSRQYMQNVYRLMWKLVELGARSAGLTTAAVADGQTNQPTNESRANKVLQCAQSCLADLLKGQASKQVVEDSKSAADNGADGDQQQQQQRQAGLQFQPPQTIVVAGASSGGAGVSSQVLLGLPLQQLMADEPHHTAAAQQQLVIPGSPLQNRRLQVALTQLQPRPAVQALQPQEQHAIEQQVQHFVLGVRRAGQQIQQQHIQQMAQHLNISAADVCRLVTTSLQQILAQRQQQQQQGLAASCDAVKACTVAQQQQQLQQGQRASNSTAVQVVQVVQQITASEAPRVTETSADPVRHAAAPEHQSRGGAAAETASTQAAAPAVAAESPPDHKQCQQDEAIGDVHPDVPAAAAATVAFRASTAAAAAAPAHKVGRKHYQRIPSAKFESVQLASRRLSSGGCTKQSSDSASPTGAEDQCRSPRALASAVASRRRLSNGGCRRQSTDSDSLAEPEDLPRSASVPTSAAAPEAVTAAAGASAAATGSEGAAAALPALAPSRQLEAVPASATTAASAVALEVVAAAASYEPGPAAATTAEASAALALVAPAAPREPVQSATAAASAALAAAAPASAAAAGGSACARDMLHQTFSGAGVGAGGQHDGSGGANRSHVAVTAVNRSNSAAANGDASPAAMAAATSNGQANRKPHRSAAMSLDGNGWQVRQCTGDAATRRMSNGIRLSSLSPRQQEAEAAARLRQGMLLWMQQPVDAAVSPRIVSAAQQHNDEDRQTGQQEEILFAHGQAARSPDSNSKQQDVVAPPTTCSMSSVGELTGVSNRSGPGLEGCDGSLALFLKGSPDEPTAAAGQSSCPKVVLQPLEQVFELARRRSLGELVPHSQAIGL